MPELTWLASAFPNFLRYIVVSFALAGLFLGIYVLITPWREFALIRGGNAAAAIALIGALLGPPGCSERRRVLGIVASGVLVLLIAWNFIYFYPIYTGTEIPVDGWRSRMWLDTWV